MLAARSGLVWFRPSAGTTAFVRLLNESGRALADRAAAADLLVLPGSVFGDEWSQYVRLGFGRRDAVEVFERLAHVL